MWYLCAEYGIHGQIVLNSNRREKNAHYPVTGFFDILLTDILPTKPCKNWLVPSNPEEVGFYNGTGLLVWPTSGAVTANYATFTHY